MIILSSYMYTCTTVCKRRALYEDRNVAPAGFLFGAKVSAVAFPALVGCASHKQLNLAVQFLCSEGQNPVGLAARYFGCEFKL